MIWHPRQWIQKVPLEVYDFVRPKSCLQKLTVGEGSGCWGVITHLFGEVVRSLVKATLAQSKWTTNWLMEESSKHKCCALYFSTDDEEHHFPEKIANWTGFILKLEPYLFLAPQYLHKVSFLLWQLFLCCNVRVRSSWNHRLQRGVSDLKSSPEGSWELSSLKYRSRVWWHIKATLTDLGLPIGFHGSLFSLHPFLHSQGEGDLEWVVTDVCIHLLHLKMNIILYNISSYEIIFSLQRFNYKVQRGNNLKILIQWLSLLGKGVRILNKIFLICLEHNVWKKNGLMELELSPQTHNSTRWICHCLHMYTPGEQKESWILEL